MAQQKRNGAVLAAALVLGGCSFVSDALFPSLSGEEPAAKGQQSQSQAPSGSKEAAAPKTAPRPAPAAPPQLGTTNFVPPAVTQASPTGTVVGAKVAQLREELKQLQKSINEHNARLQELRAQTVRHAQAYHGTVAAINSRLQVGTTPGNPVLVNQWNTAQLQLDGISSDIARMNSLANRVANDSSTAAYLLETTRATYGLSGAVDEDHRQLAILEDEVNRTVVLIDRLLNELSQDINRQSAYVGRERQNLTTLSIAVKNGELLGSSLANRAFSPAPYEPSPMPGSVSGGFNRNGMVAPQTATGGQRRPLVVIRFDRPNVEYESALYTAISRALERRPQAEFDVVAVSPADGSAAQSARSANEARRNAENVMRSLAAMGLPASRVSLSAGTSAQARTNEVQIFVR